MLCSVVNLISASSSDPENTKAVLPVSLLTPGGIDLPPTGPDIYTYSFPAGHSVF